jgi:hypothetical protein
LHDQEVRVVDVQLNRLEEVLYRLLLGAVAIDEVFVGSIEDDLSGDADRCIFFEADRGLLLIPVVENDRNACLLNAGLSTLVDEVLVNC